MGNDGAELLEQALKLPPEVRAELADSLIASLDEQADPGVEDAWNEEIARRLEELRSGKVAPLGWDEVRRHIRSRRAECR